MNFTELPVRRPIAITMLVVGIILIGLVSSSRIPFNLLPEITYPKVTIRTEYPHAAPEEVENLVTKPIEQAVGIINNVVKLNSVSRPGVSEVIVEFRWGVDMDVAVMDIREKLQILEGFLPEEVKKPVLLRYDPSTDPIMTIGVAGKIPLSELRFLVEREIERELERIDGVAAVKVEGGYEDEIVIGLDEKKLTRFGLSPDLVIDRLKRENINLAGGTLTEAGEELAVRTLNEFQTLEEIKGIIISSQAPTSAGGGKTSGLNLAISGGSLGSASGIAGLLMGGLSGISGLGALLPGGVPAGSEVKVLVPIRLGDIAEVRARHKPREQIVRLNGKECIKVSIYKEGDANIVQVANSVHRALEEIYNNFRVEAASEFELKKLNSIRERIKRTLNFGFYLFFNFKPFQLYQPELHLINELEIVSISDQSRFIREAIYSVIQSALWGGLLAILALYFFLRNLASTIIIGLAIPLALITTFNLMFFSGISFNTMSLGGMALGVGVLVDSSIVVLENILRHRSSNPDLRASAVMGAKEMVGPITASTLTNIIVFFPILYVEGMARQIFGDLAWTVAFSMVASWVIALMLVPMMSVFFGERVRIPKKLLDIDLESSYQELKTEEWRPHKFPRWADFVKFPPEKEPGSRARLIRILSIISVLVKGMIEYGFSVWFWLLRESFGRAFNWLTKISQGILYFPLQGFDKGFGWLKHHYPGLVGWALNRPKKILGLSLGLIVLSWLGLYLTGFELLPDVDQGEFRIHYRLPVGTPLSENDRKMTQIENKIPALPEADKITNLFTTIGASIATSALETEKGENLSEMAMVLVSKSQRDFSDDQMIERFRRLLKQEVSLNFGFSKPQLFSYKNPIELEIVGYNLSDLRKASQLVMEQLAQIPGLVDLDSSVKEANPEVAIIVDRERVGHYGLSSSQIAEILNKKLKANFATHFREADKQTEIVVEVREDQRATISQLSNLSIQLPKGGLVPLSALVEIKPSQGPGNITRVGGSRVALITANLQGITLSSAVDRINQKLINLELPRGCFYRITGQNEEMKRSITSLYLALFLALFLVYIVMAVQYENLVHPFVIMFGAFYSLIGVTILFLLTRTTINVFSLIGVMMMLGISVNDAIVLVETINLRRKAGRDRVPAILDAVQMRVRPILITTLTTVLGMVPMALPLGAGYELRSPMAIAVIGGLITATICTMTIVPVVYLIIDRAGERLFGFFRAGK